MSTAMLRNIKQKWRKCNIYQKLNKIFSMVVLVSMPSKTNLNILFNFNRSYIFGVLNLDGTKGYTLKSNSPSYLCHWDKQFSSREVTWITNYIWIFPDTFYMSVHVYIIHVHVLFYTVGTTLFILICALSFYPHNNRA